MCGAMKGAVTGALVFEGLAKDLDEAAELAASGEITFSPCHEHDCVGSMAGVTSASMFMHIVKNKTYGNIAYTNMSEQMAKILRMGANDQSVIDRLNWMRDAGTHAARRDENYRRNRSALNAGAGAAYGR